MLLEVFVLYVRAVVKELNQLSKEELVSEVIHHKNEITYLKL